LGMTNSHFHDSPSVLVPNRASGHRRGSSGFQVELDDWAWAGRGEPVLVGNTGLFTTSRDLLLWEQNLAEVRVGNPTLVAAMQEPTILGSGEVSLYGFGLQIGTHRGLRTIAHGGSDPGYSAYVVRYPAQGLAIAVLCNLEGISTARLARSVADVYLEHLFTAPGSSSTPAGPTVVPLSPQEQARYVGLFYDHLNHIFRSVFIRDGRLMVSPRPDNSLGVELTAVGPNRFLRPGGIVVEYVPGSAEQDPQYREGMEEESSRRVFARVTASAPSNTELVEFAGQYASSELDTLYTLAARNAELVLQVKGRAPVALRPVFPDAFYGLIGLVRFSRDTQQQITGFTLNTSDVRGLGFDRVTR